MTLRLPGKLLLSLTAIFIFIACANEQDALQPLDFDRYSYSGIYLDISQETDNARSTYWTPDGTRMFITGRFTENVVAYDVSEPWMLTDVQFSNEFDISNEFGSTTDLSRAHGLYFREDGQKMWVFNRTEIWAYRLDEPWDVTTASAWHHVDLSEFVLRGHDVDFSPDGLKIFIDDRNAEAVHEMHLSEPWDLTTGEWHYTLDISDLEKEVRGIEMIADGRIMLLLDTVRMELMQYTLSEPYSVESAVYHSSFDLSGQTDDPRGLSINPDYTHFYITGRNQEQVYQYSLMD